MKRYKKYMFIILSVLLAGGCVQEDINEALRREAELNVRMGKLREWISDTNNEVRLLATIVNTMPTHDYIESVTELPDGSGTLIVFHKGGDILIKNGLTGNKGENGNDGANGENGSDGANGTDGTALTVRTEPTVKTGRTELMVPMGIMAVTDRTVPMVRMAKTELTVTTAKTA